MGGRDAYRTLPWFVATLGGLGRFPRAPGTAASLAAVLLYGLLYGADPRLPLVFLLVLVPLAVWGAGRCETLAGRRDPPEVVVDEWVGQFVCLLGVEPTPGGLVAGFIAFRVFDVVKPPPVGRAERLPGGLGIVADDVVAGVMGRMVLFVLAYAGFL